MVKFDISTAATSCFLIFKQHGLKIALAQILVFVAITGFILLLFLDVVSLFTVTMLENPEMLIEELGDTISNAVIGVIVAFALILAGYFIGWRIALSREQDNFLGAITYGIIAAFPALFALIAVYIALVITGLFVGLLFGKIGGGNLLMASAETGGGITVALISIGIFGLMMFLSARLGIAGPIMAAKGSYNPFSAIAESWRLTRNNSLMIMLFLGLVFVGVSLVQFAMGLIAGLAATASTAFAFGIFVIVPLASLMASILVPAAIYESLVDKNIDIEDVFD